MEHTRGKESLRKQYTGGTIFVDHASRLIYIVNQVSLRVGESLQSKNKFERWAEDNEVKIQKYHTDNIPYFTQPFKKDLEEKRQDLTASGVGAHHQNPIAERAIRTVTERARTLILHALLHWPTQVDLRLWPFAMEYAAYIWNSMPQEDLGGFSPLEIFSGS